MHSRAKGNSSRQSFAGCVQKAYSGCDYGQDKDNYPYLSVNCVCGNTVNMYETVKLGT